MKIGLDAGHGLKTLGKQTPDGIKEWTLNDKVRDKIVKLLKDYDVEIINCDNDEGNVNEGLTTRRSMYVNKKVDAFVSIHHNAFTGIWNNATGVEVYVDRNHTTKDMELAKAVYKNLPNYTGLKGRGIKKSNFTVINQNKVPAVLVEGGFMDNKNDYAVITSDKGQEAYAKAVAEGLIEFLGLKKKNNTVNINTNTKYKVGDKVTVSSYYASSTDLSDKAIHKTATGTITRIVDGARNPYLLNDGDLGWCNDGDIRGFANKTTNSKTLSVGMKVKIKVSAKTYCTGQPIPDSIKGKTYTVKQIGTKKYPNGVLLNEIMSWIPRSSLEY